MLLFCQVLNVKLKKGGIQSIKWWDTVYQMVGYSLSYGGGIQLFSYSECGATFRLPPYIKKKNNTHSSSLNRRDD